MLQVHEMVTPPPFRGPLPLLLAPNWTSDDIHVAERHLEACRAHLAPAGLEGEVVNLGSS